MNKTNLLLGGLLLCGLLLRTINIAHQPVSLYWDEASIGYEAYSLASTGKDMHGHSWAQAIFPAYGDYKAPVYIWLTALVTKITGPTPAAVRLPSAILGTLTIAVVFHFAKLFGQSPKTAWFSAGALTLLPWHIQFSRTGFEANAAVFFVALSLYYALKASSGGAGRNTVYSSLFGVIATYTYFSARIVVPLMIAWTILFLGKTTLSKLGNLILWAGIFAGGILPLYLSPYAQPANQIRLSSDNITQNHRGIVYSNSLTQADNFVWYSKFLHHRYLYLTQEFAGNLLSHFNPDYLFFSGDKNPRHSTGVAGLMLPLMFPLFVTGVLASLKGGPKGWYLLGLWLIFLVPASVPREVPHALRSLNALIPLCLLLGLGAGTLSDWSQARSGKSVAFALYGLLLGLNFMVYTAYLFRQYPQNSNQAWQDGYPQLANYVTARVDQYDYLVVTPGDRLYLYFLFYGAYPPQTLQAERATRTSGSADFSVNRLGKISFRPIVWQDDRRGPSSSLLIGPPGDFPPEVKIKDTILDSRGTVQFVSVDLNNI